MAMWTRILSQRVIVGISLSAFLPELPRILHITTNMIFSFNLSVVTSIWNLLTYVDLKKKFQLNRYEIPQSPCKEKHVPVLQKSLGFLKIYIRDMKCDQYAQITDHFNLKPISQFREGKLVTSMIHYSLSA